MTAATRRCIHEMLPGTCSICSRHPDDRLYDTKAMQDPTRDKHTTVLPLRSTVAEFVGRCPGCRGPIRPGDTIFLSLDEQWVCSTCGESS